MEKNHNLPKSIPDPTSSALKKMKKLTFKYKTKSSELSNASMDNRTRTFASIKNVETEYNFS